MRWDAEPGWLTYLSALFRVSINVPEHGRARKGYIKKVLEKSEYCTLHCCTLPELQAAWGMRDTISGFAAKMFHTNISRLAKEFFTHDIIFNFQDL